MGYASWRRAAFRPARSTLAEASLADLSFHNPLAKADTEQPIEIPAASKGVKKSDI
jgi:hypothetical protein